MWWLVRIGAAVAMAAAVLAARICQETQARKEAQLESQEKSRFLTNLSHELRTPLQAILGYADKLSRDTSLSPVQAHDVDAIIRASKHMRVRSTRCSTTRGPRRSARHSTRRAIELRALIEECMALVEPGANARGLQTRITFGREVPTHFVTDGIQLRQILGNLLSNAVKYTPRGMVECRVKGDSEHLIIEVVDTGHRHPARATPSAVQGIRTVWRGAYRD